MSNKSWMRWEMPNQTGKLMVPAKQLNSWAKVFFLGGVFNSWTNVKVDKNRYKDYKEKGGAPKYLILI